MSITYLKKAAKNSKTETETAHKVAADMLATIEVGGEQAVRDYAAKLDGWSGDIVLDAAAIERQTRDIAQTVKDDIAFATGQVRRFADAQRASVQDFAMEISPASNSARSWSRSIPSAVTCRPAATLILLRPICRSPRRVRQE